MKKLRTIFKPIVIFVLVIITFFSFYDFVYKSSDLNTKKVLDHLCDVGKQEANNFNQQYNNSKNIIQSASNLIGNSFKSKEDIGNILENVKLEQNIFQRLWYVDENKNLNNYEENIVFETSNKFVDEMFKGKSGITDVFTSSYNNKKIVSIYAPVYSNNIVIGGVVGVFEINKVHKDFLYNDVFDEQAYVFTIDKDGNIIHKIRNKNSLFSGDNYFTFLNDEVSYSKGSFEQVIKDLNSNKSSFITYQKNGDDRMSYYTPLGINDWYIFTVITTDFINEQTNAFNTITITLILKLVFVLAIILYFIIKYFIKTNKTNIEMNKKLETSNKKIDIVLKQISDRIFEYDIENDSIVLDAWNDFPKILLNNFLSNLHNYNFVCKEDEKLLKEKFYSIGIHNRKVEFDAKLPYISKDFDTWYHISMIYDEESGHAIGTLKNSTKEMREYLDLLQDNMFKNSIYSHSLFMFAVNVNSRKIVIYQENGEYHNIIDMDYEDYLGNELLQYVHKKDREKVIRFFDYQNIYSLYNDDKKSKKIDFRFKNEDLKDYRWVNTRVQFERESNYNELLMIVYALDIDEEKKKQLEIEFLAQRDVLTEIYNRKTFNELVDKNISNLLNKISYSAYMILDLDNFKEVNDKLGHSIGDKVLKDVADVLEEVFDDNGYVGRFGGDEFVVFIYNQKSYADIEDKCNKTIDMIKNMNKKYTVSASIGVCFVTHEKSYQELFVKADKALYQVKNSGKNNYQVFYDGLEK